MPTDSSQLIVGAEGQQDVKQRTLEAALYKSKWQTLSTILDEDSAIPGLSKA